MNRWERIKGGKTLLLTFYNGMKIILCEAQEMFFDLEDVPPEARQAQEGTFENLCGWEDFGDIING